jgi:hypothetical protein
LWVRTGWHLGRRAAGRIAASPGRRIGRWMRRALRRSGRCCICIPGHAGRETRLWRSKAWRQSRSSLGHTMRRHAGIVRMSRLRIARISIWRWWVIWLPLSMVDRRTDLPLPTLFLNRHFWIDSPIEPLPFLVTLHKCIVLAKVVSHAGLPTAGCRLELVPRVLLLDVVVNLLEVHLTSVG